ncbi:MAG: AI-2E family transporter [Thermodesulfobacteriota bacterium]|jgi:predicted PurR-regulated permease PerM
MKREHIFLIFILFVAFLSFYFLYQILSPFLGSVFWAILLAMVFYPLFQKLQRLLEKREVLSAITMTLLVILVILLPLSLLIISLANEVVGAYQGLEEMIKTGRLETYLQQIRDIPFFNWIWERLNQYLDFSQIDPESLLLKNLEQVSTFLFNQTSKILKGLSTFVFGFFFTLLSLYYLFKDGDRLFGKLKEILPIPAKERDLLILRFKQMVYATIYGGLLIAIMQGVLGGVIFWILGISSPILWGTAMAFFSFIPIGGTAFIWVPATILLFIQGAFWKGIILLGLGIFGISMVDNLLRPFFISAKTNIHPLLLFFAVLGGIQAFGLVGLVVGPLIATLCLTLIEIYTQGIKPR